MKPINEKKNRLQGSIRNFKNVLMMILMLHSGLLLSDGVYGNNVRIAGEPVVQLNGTSDSLTLTFTLSWDNSWRDDFNWDAVWLFVKYKREGSNDAWSHLYLGGSQAGTANLEIDPGNTGSQIVGAFVYPKHKGTFDIAGEQVSLQAPLNGLSASDLTEGKIYFAVTGIEMVLIPYGAYYLGDGRSNRTFRSIPTRIIPADADIIGTDPSFSYSCHPMPYYNNSAPEAAANRINDGGWCDLCSSVFYVEYTGYNVSWIVNFKEPKTIRTLGVSISTWSNYYHVPSEDWYLLGSLDSLSWDTLSRCMPQEATTDQVSYPIKHAIRVESPGAYSYYRLFFPKSTTGRYGPMIANVAMSEQDLYPNSVNNLYVDHEDAISFGKGLNALYVDDGTAWSGILPAVYPKGYKGFYVMKYELSQEQYVNFLNMLSYAQQKNRIGNNLDDLHRGDYVFGDPAHPSCRNGIAVFSNRGTSQPVVFGNNLNPSEPFFAGDDGQTLACNYMTGADMLSYLDWSGLRPLSELEYEKMSRTPNRVTPGEYAWNSTVLNCLPGLSGLSSSTLGTENEVPVHLNTNANAGNPDFGPVRCGSFGSSTSTQEQSGGSFYGVMELSGNLGEMYYSVTGGSALNTSSSGNEYHGDGVIDNSGDYNVGSYWNRSSEATAFMVRGGSFASADSLLRVSDRSVVKGYDNTDRDSTVTFRGGRSISGSVDPGEIGCDAICSGPVTVSSVRDAVADCDLSYLWYVKRPGSSDYELIPGETGVALTDFEAESVGTSSTVTYTFRRKAVALTGEGSVDFGVTITNIFWKLNVDSVYLDACGGTEEIKVLQGTSGAVYNWSYGGNALSTGIIYVPSHAHFGNAQGQYTVECVFSLNGCQDRKYVIVRKEEVPQQIFTTCGSNLIDCSGNIYPTLQIGTQCWMGKNLNAGRTTTTTGATHTIRGIQKLCYGNTASNCALYGGLYTWYEAMYGENIDGYKYVSGNASVIQGICPDGWHIPTPEEWNILYTNWQSSWNIQKGGHWVCSRGQFISLDQSGAWWATQVMGAYAAYASGGGAPSAGYDYWSGVVKGPLDKNSVRCIRD